jgi:hypothetical protein
MERIDQGILDEMPVYERSSFVETGQGTLFSRHAQLQGAHNITLGGKVKLILCTQHQPISRNNDPLRLRK